MEVQSGRLLTYSCLAEGVVGIGLYNITINI